MPQTSHTAPPFFRTFSYREVLSACTLALIMLTAVYGLRYFGVELYGALVGTSVFIAVLLLHVVYRQEHKRSNDFLGRIMHDSMYFTFLFFFRVMLGWYSSSEFSFDEDNPIVLLFLILIMFTVFEGLVSLLMHLFDKLRWRVL